MVGTSTLFFVAFLFYSGFFGFMIVWGGFAKRWMGFCLEGVFDWRLLFCFVFV